MDMDIYGGQVGILRNRDGIVMDLGFDIHLSGLPPKLMYEHTRAFSFYWSLSKEYN